MFRRFLRWMARKLAPAEPPRRLDRIQYIDEHGRDCVGRIVGPVGLYLDVRPISETGMQARLVGEHDAADRRIFWEQWRAWGGELFYEDGRAWEPPVDF